MIVVMKKCQCCGEIKLGTYYVGTFFCKNCDPEAYKIANDSEL